MSKEQKGLRNLPEISLQNGYCNAVEGGFL